MKRYLFPLWLLLLTTVICGTQAPAAQADTPPLITPWQGQVVGWYYNPEFSPQIGLSPEFIEDLVIAGANNWGTHVRFVYLGHTDVRPACTANASPRGANDVNVVGWGNVWPYAGLECFDSTPNPLHFNIVMNVNTAHEYSNILGTLTHEFGHALGLPHPDNCNVKFVLMCPDGTVLVRPTPDDFKALDILYPKRAHQLTFTLLASDP